MMPISPVQLARESQQLAMKCNNERIANTMQWAMLGCLILAGTAAAVHLVKDLTGNWHKKPARDHDYDLHDRVQRHYEGHSR